VDSLLGQISAAQGFAVRINLLTLDEVRTLFERYRSVRPDIFNDTLL
jgi:hypothetical protein